MALCFSVIVPIYNVEEYLRECIDSLISQSFVDVEIILVDDGSPDNCPAICDEYADLDERVKVIHKENGGLVSARQAGCMAAKGRYILNVDGDDWVCPDYFEVLNRIIQDYNPDMVCFGANHVYGEFIKKCPGCEKTGLIDRQQIEEDVFPILIENSIGEYFPPAIWAKAIKREIYVKCQMAVDKRIRIGEDHAVTKPAIYKSDTIFLTDQCLYNYRINDNSMTNNKKAFSWNDPKLIGQLFEAQFCKNDFVFNEQIYRYVVHNAFNVSVSQFYSSKSYREVRKAICKEIGDPFINRVIHAAKFSKLKNEVARIVLKNRWTFILLCYSYLK